MEEVAIKHQIAQATAEKEQTKLKFEALKRAVDSHVLRLTSILDGPVSFDRLASAIQAMDVELRNSDLMPSLAVPADGAYNVLRTSLTETQKRCQDLNTEMLRIAEANEELHTSLRSMKGTNRRLVEEVQKQTEELSHLTQQRLQEMEKLSRQEEAFSREKATWTHEAQKALEEEQKRLDEDFCVMKEAFTVRLDSCWRMAASAASRVEMLRVGQRSLKAEAHSMSYSFCESLKQMERELLGRISEEDKKMRGELNRLQDLEHHLQVKVKAEREVRGNEAETWRSRHQALAADLDALLARRDAEVAELQAKVDMAISAREREETTARQERQSLQEKAEALAKDLAVGEATLQTAHRKSVQMEARLAAVQGERDRLQASVESLRQQVKFSDEALAEAVKSNEALREQMEIQRMDAQTASEREMKAWREKFQAHLVDQEQQHQAEQADLTRRVRDLEELLGNKAGQIQALRENLAEKNKARESLLRDLTMWKAQHELASRMKADVERDFDHFKEEFLGRRLPEKRDEFEALRKKQADLEAKKASLVDEVQKLEREIQAQDAQDASRQSGVAELRREVLAEAERTKRNLTEVESALAAAKAEAATAQQQLVERKERLEQELQRVTADCDAERREFERKIQAERQSCETLRRAAERRRAEQQSTYQAALDGPAQEIASLEGSISEIQQNAELEISSLHQKSEQLRSRTEELETELICLQEKLARSDREVQESTSQLNLVKARNRSSLETLQQEKMRKTERLKQVQTSIAQKAEQLQGFRAPTAPPRWTSPARLSPVASARVEAPLPWSAIEDASNPLRGAEGWSRTSHSDLRRYLSEHDSRDRHLQDIRGRMQRSFGEDRSLRQPLV